MRAAIYARVSSTAQRDQHTIESQLAELRPYVAAQKWKTFDTYLDDGKSAKTGMLDRRDEWARLMRDAEARRFDVLVVFDVDRLTRTGSIEERALILGPFQRLGISIATPTGGILDLRSFLGEFWVTVKALVAAEENRLRGERIKAGKRRAIAEGRKPSGPTPYGLRYERKTGEWSVDPVTGPIVVEMFERVAAGEPCLEIAHDFHRRGVKRPRGQWARHRVWGIIRSRHPVGEWTVDKRQKIVIAVPSIVSEELWQRAQAALIRHKKRGLRRTKHVYLLEGLGVCGECGAPMLIRSGTWGRGDYWNVPAYVCRRRKNWKELLMSKDERCRAEIVPSADVDDRVWAKLSELISNPALIEAALDQRRDKSDDPRDWKVDADGYRRRIEQMDRAESALLERFSRGRISEKALDTELERLANERETIRGQLVFAERAALNAGAHRKAVDDARTLLARMAVGLPKATPAQRRELVAMFIPPGAATFNGAEIQLFAEVPEAAMSRGDGAGVAISPVDAYVWGSQCEANQRASLRIRLVA